MHTYVYVKIVYRTAEPVKRRRARAVEGEIGEASGHQNLAMQMVKVMVNVIDVMSCRC